MKQPRISFHPHKITYIQCELVYFLYLLIYSTSVRNSIRSNSLIVMVAKKNSRKNANKILCQNIYEAYEYISSLGTFALECNSLWASLPHGYVYERSECSCKVHGGGEEPKEPGVEHDTKCRAKFTSATVYFRTRLHSRGVCRISTN